MIQESSRSSSTIALALPSLQSLRTWVHRPQAVAACFVSDVHALQALEENDGQVKRTTRDVFLLRNFPCKVVELVGWVAGVDQRETSINLTLDDGDGQHVLTIVVHLTQVEVRPPQPNASSSSAPAPSSSTFPNAKQRKAARRAAAIATGRPPPPLVKVYQRPDVRVGDTVRVVGRVDEWSSKRPVGGYNVHRRIVVDDSGGGSLAVVDVDEHFAHTNRVEALHEHLYAQPFMMPPAPSAVAPTPSVMSSPSKSILSSFASDVDDDPFDRELPDPSKLSSSRLTESTFRLYLIDHMTRETARAMRAVLRQIALVGSQEPLSILADVFPEYRAAFPNQSNKRSRPCDVLASSTAENRMTRLKATCTVIDLTSDDSCHSTSSCAVIHLTGDDQTPRATRTTRSRREHNAQSKASRVEVPSTPTPRKTFRSRAERERDYVRDTTPTPGARAPRTHDPPSPTPTRTFRSRTERERERECSVLSDMTNSDTGSLCDTSALSYLSPPQRLQAFTTASLLTIPHLHDLAARVTDARARTEEKHRRRREKDGGTTARDRALVADRRARGLGAGEYKLTSAEREKKMRALVGWAIRQAVADGGLVPVPMSAPGAVEKPSGTSTWTHRLRSSGAETEGYLPLAPELVAPLLVPLLAAERARRAATWRKSTAEIDASVLTARLRAWEPRWERVGEWALEEALDWGEAQGCLARV